MYRESLNSFRTSTLPSKFNRKFAEAPESNIIRDELANIYDRYTKLRNLSREHYKRQKDLTDKHQKYDTCCQDVLPWIDVAYEKLMQELKEPVAPDPENVRAQMDRIKVLIKNMFC